MSTYVVSIGRNLGKPAGYRQGEAMDVVEWSRFREEVRAELDQAGLEIVFTGDGDGVYEGVVEPSYTLVAVGDLLTAPQFDHLVGMLGLIGFRYYQDSVAVTSGVTVFAEGKVSA